MSDLFLGDADLGPYALNTVQRLSECLSAAWLEQHAVLPLELREQDVVVGTWRNPPDPQAEDDLSLLFSAVVQWVAVAEEEARLAIRRAYDAESVTASGMIDGLAGGQGSLPEGELALDDLVHQANEAPVIRLVNLLLLEALDAGASDVHLEWYAQRLRTRYRVDGVLDDAPSPPLHLAPAVISRLKIMADLDVAERRVPQDGRIRLRLQDRQVDVRVSTVPTLHGESIVLRLLDKAKGWGSLEELGLESDLLARYVAAISRPTGIVLVTGPTGSGKTTTLYASVDRIRTGREKIVTVEDPIEYELPGVPQVPVNPSLGVTFASALRALLRQDPDVMLVGEIRDAETAEMATHAALTGHLVLSTLHTNDAASALTRLLDLGVEPFLVASTVHAVLAQRLVRLVCQGCCEQVEPDPAVVEMLGATPGALVHVTQGRGCPRCRGSGFKGRSGIYELLLLTTELGNAVLRRGTAAELQSIALNQGMRSLASDGLRLVQQGLTTPSEVLRVTPR